MDVVHSVDHKVKLFPELVVEDFFGIWPNSGHVVLNINGVVHFFGNVAGSL